MILDSQNMFSDRQAITANAASTNTLDLRPVGQPVKGIIPLKRDIGPGMKIPLLVQVVEDFDNLTDLTVTVQIDDDSAFGTAEDVISQTIALADLLEGRQFDLSYMPNHVDKNYVRLLYTVNGAAPSQGAITAAVSGGNDTNNNTY